MSRHSEASERMSERARAAIGARSGETGLHHVTLPKDVDVARLLLAGAVPFEELDEVLDGLTAAASNTMETLGVAWTAGGPAQMERALRMAMTQIFLTGLFMDEEGRAPAITLSVLERVIAGELSLDEVVAAMARGKR